MAGSAIEHGAAIRPSARVRVLSALVLALAHGSVLTPRRGLSNWCCAVGPFAPTIEAVECMTTLLLQRVKEDVERATGMWVPVARSVV